MFEFLSFTILLKLLSSLLSAGLMVFLLGSLFEYKRRKERESHIIAAIKLEINDTISGIANLRKVIKGYMDEKIPPFASVVSENIILESIKSEMLFLPEETLNAVLTFYLESKMFDDVIKRVQRPDFKEFKPKRKKQIWEGILENLSEMEKKGKKAVESLDASRISQCKLLTQKTSFFLHSPRAAERHRSSPLV